MTRREQALLLGAAAAIVLGSVTIYFEHYRARPVPPAPNPAAARPAPQAPSASQAPSVPPVPPVPAAAARAVPRELRAGVTGAVRTPGTYTFRQGDRVGDLIKAAGGLSENADASSINQVATLIDGTTLYVPSVFAAGQEDATRARRDQAAAGANPAEYLSSR